MEASKREASGGRPLPPVVIPPAVKPVAAIDMIRPPLLQRMIVGSWVLITINTLIFGFVIFLQKFFLGQDMKITKLIAYALEHSAGSLVRCALGRYLSDGVGRRMSIIGASIVTIISGYIYARFDATADPAIVLS